METIAASVVQTKDQLHKFIGCTLLAVENGGVFSKNNEDDPITAAIAFLCKHEFIRLQDNEALGESVYVATKLGAACLSSSLAPDEGFKLCCELMLARQSFNLESELHAIYTVTPFSAAHQLSTIDWASYHNYYLSLPAAEQRVGELVQLKNSFFVSLITKGEGGADPKKLLVYKRFYVALALKDLVNEIPLNTVARKFNCNRGMLQSLQQSAATFAGIVTSFCTALNWNVLAGIVKQFQERLYFGIQPDLLDLLRIPSLNAQRARALFTADIKSLQELASADEFKVEKILYDCICFDTENQREGEKTEFEANQRKKLRKLFITGKNDLTVAAAAKLLISEARQFFEVELGIDNVQWQKEAPTTPVVNGKKRKSEEMATPNAEPYSLYKSDTLTIFTYCLDMNCSELIDSEHFQMHIVNVFGNQDFFTAFDKQIDVSKRITISLGLSPLENSAIGGNLLPAQLKKHFIVGKKFISGLSICFDTHPYVFYLDLAADDSLVEFSKKKTFVEKLFTRKDLTIAMFDTKEQLKLLQRAFSGSLSVKAAFRDPKVAYWLLNPHGEFSIESLVAKFAQWADEKLKLKKTNDEKFQCCFEAFLTSEITRALVNKLHEVNLLHVFKGK